MPIRGMSAFICINKEDYYQWIVKEKTNKFKKEIWNNKWHFASELVLIEFLIFMSNITNQRVAKFVLYTNKIISGYERNLSFKI